jgi:hypothetical protein
MSARLFGIVAVLALAAPAAAVSVPYLEDFSLDASGWVNSTSGPLDWVASGGPDGGSYVATTAPTVGGFGTIHFRANDSLDASGDAFVGNWIGTVSSVSASVFHDAPVPVVFFFRFAGAGAMVGFSPAVAPGTWTTITVAIDPSLTPAGGTFASVMSNVANLQVGVQVPVGSEGIPYTFGLDKVQIVPEPATAGMLAGGLLVLAASRRRSRR